MAISFGDLWPFRSVICGQLGGAKSWSGEWEGRVGGARGELEWDNKAKATVKPPPTAGSVGSVGSVRVFRVD